MKKYEKPMILEEQTLQFESVLAAGGSGDQGGCPKSCNQRVADQSCKNCPHYVEVAGLFWLNDRCDLM